MKIESPQTKIILNLSKFTYKYYSKGRIQLKNDFLNIYKLNVYKDKLDAFILKNFDVDLIYFDTSIIGDENHVWGIHPTHYEPKYYKSATIQLREIISRYENSEDDTCQRDFRKSKRDHTIQKLNHYTDPILFNANAIFKNTELENEIFHI